MRESLLRSLLIAIRLVRKELITTHKALLVIWSCTQEASPPRPSSHTRKNTKKDAQGCFTSLADLEHVRQDADFIYARHELIIYSVFGHVATRLVVMLHPGSVS